MFGERRRAGLGGGEEGADMLTFEVDEVSDDIRSMSFSNGLSSSKASIVSVPRGGQSVGGIQAS